MLGALALIAAIAAFWTLLHRHADATNPAKEIPLIGTVISAEDGSIITKPDRSPIGQLITEPAGGSFRACDLATVESKDDCKFTAVKGPILVEMGDVLWVGRSLREQGERPLPFVTLIARRRWESNHSAAAEMVVEWPGVRRGNERETNKIIFEMPGEYGYVNLVYVPGSAELRGPTWHDFIAHLPDGIMEGGISLANLGPPVSCFECFDQYKRYVFFEARLEGHHSGEA